MGFVIEDSSYGENRKVLKEDPIIIDMAGGVRHVPMEQLTHPDGTPRHEFMMGALDEYHKRGGQNSEHIGGPAEAILMLLKENNG